MSRYSEREPDFISGGGAGGGESGSEYRYKMNHLKPAVAVKPPNNMNFISLPFLFLFFYSFMHSEGIY